MSTSGEVEGEVEPRAARGRWTPAPALGATAALHVCGALALAAPHPKWPLIAGALAANHGILFAASVAPRSRLLGPNVVRLPRATPPRPEVALTFDDGPDPEVTPRVLDLLDRHGAVASFFCIGERAEAHPRLVREIAARGHSVESHSHRHSLAFGWYGPRRLTREIGAAQRAIGDAAGVPPRFFRAPYGTRNPMLDFVLARFGLIYVSWKRRGYDAVDGDAQRVLHRLVRRLAPQDVLLLHDGSTARRGREATVLRVLPPLLERLAQSGLRSVSLRMAFDGAARA
jgi:peptidoglycan/xylan/chitin deacetylase (PgdA/CDA1 family)